MPYAPASPRDRTASALAALALPALLAWVLIDGLQVRLPAQVADTLNLFTIPPEPAPPPPAPIAPNPVADTRPEGEASPPNIRSRATQVVAPPPEIRLPIPPPPVIVAPKAGTGADRSTGSAEIVGPGTGAGGVGEGTGSGGRGDGDGAGGSQTPPIWRSGRMSNNDFPRAAIEAGLSGTVEIAYTVLPNGRVADCQITRSSGYAILDQTTCRLITRRYRFDPSRNASGRPVPSTLVEKHEWIFERVEDEE